MRRKQFAFRNCLNLLLRGALRGRRMASDDALRKDDGKRRLPSARGLRNCGGQRCVACASEERDASPVASACGTSLTWRALLVACCGKKRAHTGLCYSS